MKIKNKNNSKDGKQGPSGGNGGGDFEDDTSPVKKINGVNVGYCGVVDHIQIEYVEDDGTLTIGDKHGLGDGNTKVEQFNFVKDEYLIKIHGNYTELVDSIILTTTGGEKKQCGEGNGRVNYAYEAPDGYHITGFHGRSGKYIDAIGIFTRRIPPPPPVTPPPPENQQGL